MAIAGGADAVWEIADPENRPQTVEMLLEQACATTGFENFGSPTFRIGLDRLLESLSQDADLTPEGWTSVNSLLLKRLSNRLEIEAWYESHPISTTAGTEGPFSIIGLERTGTTALANMMSLDPQFRCLRSWEQARPCPPPVLAVEENDPRRLAGIEQLANLLDARPEQRAMHLYDIDATVEDHELLGLEFSAQQAILPVFGYHSWWRNADMTHAYRYHRRVTAMLQSQHSPKRWLFKAPHHRFHLEAMLDAYPESRFVFTHRDPASAIPSFASFVYSLYPPGGRERHSAQTVGRSIHQHMLAGIERAMEARAQIGDDRFVDVHQHEIDADPIGTLERVYDTLGVELTPAMIDNVRRWVTRNYSGAHGRHSYTPEQFGLTRDAIRSDFAEYIDRFGIRMED